MAIDEIRSSFTVTRWLKRDKHEERPDELQANPPIECPVYRLSHILKKVKSIAIDVFTVSCWNEPRGISVEINQMFFPHKVSERTARTPATDRAPMTNHSSLLLWWRVVRCP
jgi:hypothetical protein